MAPLNVAALDENIRMYKVPSVCVCVYVCVCVVAINEIILLSAPSHSLLEDYVLSC